MTTKELLALVEKASELPWEAYPSEIWSVGNNREVAHRPDFNTTPNGYGQWEANAALIVAAVNSLPALCAEVDAQALRIAQQDATIARMFTREQVAELMRGMVPAFDTYGQRFDKTERYGVDCYNNCRTETLARIEAWQTQEQVK